MSLSNVGDTAASPRRNGLGDRWRASRARHRAGGRRAPAQPRYEALAIGLGCDSLAFRARSTSPEWR